MKNTTKFKRHIIKSIFKFNWTRNIILLVISNKEIDETHFDFTFEKFKNWILTSESLKGAKFNSSTHELFYTLYLVLVFGYTLYNIVVSFEIYKKIQDLVKQIELEENSEIQEYIPSIS